MRFRNTFGRLNQCFAVHFVCYSPALQHINQILLVLLQARAWGGGQKVCPGRAERVSHRHWLVDPCASVSHDVVPPATPNPFKTILSFSWEGWSMHTSFSHPSPHIAKGQFLSKIKKTQLPWPEESSWGVGEAQMPSTFSRFDFVFALFPLSCGFWVSCSAGPAMDAAEGWREINLSWKGAGRFGYMQPSRPEHHLLILLD